MNTLDRATELLRKTEQSLRDLVTEAAQSGEYADVLEIAAWARTVSDLMKQSGGTPSFKKREPAKKTATVAVPVLQLRNIKTKAQEYPRFIKQGSELIRLAWSKREKKEYRHKVSFAALKSLIAAITEKGAEGRVFSTDDFLPIHADDGSPVPTYQAYVGISLLKHVGLIDQHGRQGYSVRRILDFEKAVEDVLKKLPAA